MLRRIASFFMAAFVAACSPADEADAPPEGFVPPAADDTVGIVADDVELPVNTARILRVGTDSSTIGTVSVLRSEESPAITITIELNDVPPGRYDWVVREAPCGATTHSAAAASGRGEIEVGAAGFGEGSALLPPTVLSDADLEADRYSLAVTARGAESQVVGCATL